MVLCIEPAHHDEDVAGYHIEDLVVVTDDGAEVLTDYESAWEPQVIEERGWCWPTEVAAAAARPGPDR